ncbi:MAG: 2-oxo acid dehydrogenase subunit E2 [Alphaproteobacteria bacterium]|nr:2-oxo acid dehydrogenase subunit E2 [Alphaproteobacteria bacterium]
MRDHDRQGAARDLEPQGRHDREAARAARRHRRGAQPPRRDRRERRARCGRPRRAEAGQRRRCADGAAAREARPAAPVAPPPVAAGPASQPGARGQTKATPAVRRHARELELDVDTVPGTGKGGRVTHDDLRAFTESDMGLPVAPPALPQVFPSGTEERIKIIGVRRTIANAMIHAKRTQPHYTYVEEVDATELVALRKKLKPLAERHGVKLSFMPILMKACSVVFREFPNVNSNVSEDPFELVVKGDHNIGVACDTPNGLYVPVVKNVEQKSVLHIAAELEDLIARTKVGKARIDELKGGTFTITGVGQIGGVLATPILNHPEVAILGVNVIRDRVVPHNGEIAIRKMMYLSPSFDHRIIDGAVGARFTAALKAVIENPESLLLELA